MHVFTNTIENPRGYPYYLKLVIYSDNGLTSTTTETNGGYVLSIGEISEEIDPFTGAYKPGGMSLELMNVNDEVSDNIFGGSIAEMEARLWISYDSGTSWECLFFGTVEHEGLTRVDSDATETENRRFRVNCRHSIVSLKEVEIDTDPAAGTNVPTTGITTGVSLLTYATTADGEPRDGVSYTDYSMITLDGILQYIFSNAQFIAGSTAPTLSYDSTAMAHQGRSLTGAGITYDFDELAMMFDNPSTRDNIESFFAFSSGKYGAYGLKNLQEMLRLFMDSLLMIPVTRLTEPSGFTLDVYFEPRFRPASALTALTGSLEYTITRSLSVQEWLDGYQVITPGLPEKSYSDISYGGRIFELKNNLITGPYFNVANYVLVYTHIVPTAGLGLETVRHDGPSAQMLYGLIGTAANNINLFRYRSTDAWVGDPATGGYYGVHTTLFNQVANNLDPRARTSIYGPRGYEITCKTLKADSVWDLRLLKKITIDSVTCQIISIKRNVMTNETKIKAVEVL